MKKINLVVLCLLLTVVGCSRKEENLIFKGRITEVQPQGLMIGAEEVTSFTEIFVQIEEMDFDPHIGQSVEVTIQPEVMEIYPPVARGEMILLQTGYKAMTPEEAKVFIDAKTYGTILDVRSQEEYAEGHLENAVLLPDHEVESKAEAILGDKDELILVYCRSGRRSAEATLKLADMGYTNVYDIGGINNWPYESVK